MNAKKLPEAVTAACLKNEGQLSDGADVSKKSSFWQNERRNNSQSILDFPQATNSACGHDLYACPKIARFLEYDGVPF